VIQRREKSWSRLTTNRFRAKAFSLAIRAPRRPVISFPEILLITR
jgi:hypothetical protein